MNFVDEIRCLEPIGFSMLGHQVTDIDLFRIGFAYSSGKIGHEQIWYETGEEITRANDDGFCTTYGPYGLSTTRSIRGYQAELLDR